MFDLMHETALGFKGQALWSSLRSPDPGATEAAIKDPAWLDQVKAGDKIRFMADQINGAMTVVHLERN